MKMQKKDILYLASIENTINYTMYSKISKSVVLGICILIIPYAVIVSILTSYLLIGVYSPSIQAYLKSLIIHAVGPYFIYPASIIIILILIIISVSSLINVYTTISYSITKRSRYYGMLMSLGMRKKDVKSIFFHSLYKVFLKSLKKAFIIGCSISVGFFIIFDLFLVGVAHQELKFFVFQITDNDNAFTAVFFQMRIQWIPICFIPIYFFMWVIAKIFANGIMSSFKRYEPVDLLSGSMINNTKN